MTSSDPVKLGPYRLLGRLGAGGMGQVHAGVSPTADKVAVKVIRSELVSDDDLRERFASEVDNLKTVYRARAARFEDADVCADPPWLAVEYVPGLSLRQHLEARGLLDARAGADCCAPRGSGGGAAQDDDLPGSDVHRA